MHISLNTSVCLPKYQSFGIQIKSMEKQTGDNINIDQRESCPWFIVKQTNKNPIRIIPLEKFILLGQNTGAF